MNIFERIEENLDKECLKKEEQRLARNINIELDSHRPQSRDFSHLYSSREIAVDNEKIRRYLKKDPHHGKIDLLRDGLELEGVFYQVDQIELFEETSDDARYDYLFTDERDFAFQAFPAHKYDDLFNNTDMYCTLCNTDTNHRPIVFSIDCTTNSYKVAEKINYYQHHRPKRYQGTTSAKYFIDSQQNHPDKQNFPTGRIDIMPHFVVGCHSETSNELAKYLYGFKDPDHPDRYNQIKNPKNYQNFLSYVRTCVVAELREQAKSTLAALKQESIQDSSTDLVNLIDAYIRLDRYFSNTFDYLKQNNQIYQSYQFDPVYTQIHDACQNQPTQETPRHTSPTPLASPSN